MEFADLRDLMDLMDFIDLMGLIDWLDFVDWMDFIDLMMDLIDLRDLFGLVAFIDLMEYRLGQNVDRTGQTIDRIFSGNVQISGCCPELHDYQISSRTKMFPRILLPNPFCIHPLIHSWGPTSF